MASQTTQHVSIPTDDGDLTAALALPAEADSPHPAVLVLHELFGLNDDIRRIARRFADNGYVALAPDLYSVGPRLRPICIRRTMRTLSSGSGRAFDDIEAARAWLADRDDVDATRIAVTGFCLGGGFAILHAARSPIAAAADFYGAVPSDPAELEGICPVFAGYGERDRVFVRQAARLERHLEQLDVPHDINVYEGAGHSFMSEYRGVQSLLVRFAPMAVGYHQEASEEAWSAMLAFFAKHMAPESTEPRTA